jgi:hypothetical protein
MDESKSPEVTERPAEEYEAPAVLATYSVDELQRDAALALTTVL